MRKILLALLMILAIVINTAATFVMTSLYYQRLVVAASISVQAVQMENMRLIEEQRQNPYSQMQEFIRWKRDHTL